MHKCKIYAMYKVDECHIKCIKIIALKILKTPASDDSKFLTVAPKVVKH